jgi:hypothetical protein
MQFGAERAFPLRGLALLIIDAIFLELSYRGRLKTAVSRSRWPQARLAWVSFPG